MKRILSIITIILFNFSTLAKDECVSVSEIKNLKTSYNRKKEKVIEIQTNIKNICTTMIKKELKLYLDHNLSKMRYSLVQYPMTVELLPSEVYIDVFQINISDLNNNGSYFLKLKVLDLISGEVDGESNVAFAVGNDENTLVVSDGSRAKPHCSWSRKCEWTQEVKEICAQKLCEAAGFSSGNFVKASNNMCDSSITKTSHWSWLVDLKEYKNINYDKESAVTASCFN